MSVAYQASVDPREALDQAELAALFSVQKGDNWHEKTVGSTVKPGDGYFAQVLKVPQYDRDEVEAPPSREHHKGGLVK
jgi:hypothetical protein